MTMTDSELLLVPELQLSRATAGKNGLLPNLRMREDMETKGMMIQMETMPVSSTDSKAPCLDTSMSHKFFRGVPLSVDDPAVAAEIQPQVGTEAAP